MSMSCAFAGHRTKWNSEVFEYLKTILGNRLSLTMKSVFPYQNVWVLKFDEADFVINAGGECLEVCFEMNNKDKLQIIKDLILEWDAYKNHPSAFYLEFCPTDNTSTTNIPTNTSTTILFVSGVISPGKRFMDYFECDKPKIVYLRDLKNKKEDT